MRTLKLAAACIAAALVTLPALAGTATSAAQADPVVTLQETLAFRDALVERVAVQKSLAPTSLFEASSARAQHVPVSRVDRDFNVAMREGNQLLERGRQQVDRARSAKSLEAAQATLAKAMKAYSKASETFKLKEGN